MKKNAFTILEVILAIFILTIAVFSSFALIQQTVIGASLNQSRLVAYYLAQQEIENIRNTRDTNWLQGKDWDEGIGTKLPEKVFFLDNTESRFEKQIIVEEKNDGENNFLEVKVIIEWSERGRTHRVETINHLYNWFYN